MRPQQITFGEMREMGVRGVLIYCADYHCSRSVALSADRWPDEVRLSNIEPRFICAACGKRGAEVRPDFSLAILCGLVRRNDRRHAECQYARRGQRQEGDYDLFWHGDSNLRSEVL
jgi:hypothetical protein